MITMGLIPPWSQTQCSVKGVPVEKGFPASCLLHELWNLIFLLFNLQESVARAFSPLLLPIHTQCETLDGFLDILLYTFSGGPSLQNLCLLSLHHP